MKVVFVGDAYITSEMMRAAAKQILTENDVCKFLYFGESNRGEMRNTVKMIEAHRREEIEVPQKLFEEIVDADLLVVHLCPVNRNLIEKATKLKAVLSCRGGRENIDIDACSDRGIIVTVNPAHNANAVAEFTIGLMLCESRNICRANYALKNGKWREKFPNTATTIRELSDMTVGIIGFGSVGKLVAHKLSVFGCRILVSDPFFKPEPDEDYNCEFVTLNALLRESDIVSLHARANGVILGAEQFEIMKPTAYLINTARSIMVDPEALRHALEMNLIMGAAIDVFETEPHIDDFYREFDNITITNHRGGDTINSYSDSPKFALRNYLGYANNGSKLIFWANKDAFSAN